jgi:predicted nucleic acid-binding Zn ribbon protein
VSTMRRAGMTGPLTDRLAPLLLLCVFCSSALPTESKTSDPCGRTCHRRAVGMPPTSHHEVGGTLRAELHLRLLATRRRSRTHFILQVVPPLDSPLISTFLDRTEQVCRLQLYLMNPERQVPRHSLMVLSLDLALIRRPRLRQRVCKPPVPSMARGGPASRHHRRCSPKSRALSASLVFLDPTGCMLVQVGCRLACLVRLTRPWGLLERIRVEPLLLPQGWTTTTSLKLPLKSLRFSTTTKTKPQWRAPQASTRPNQH